MDTTYITLCIFTLFTVGWLLALAKDLQILIKLLLLKKQPTLYEVFAPIMDGFIATLCFIGILYTTYRGIQQKEKNNLSQTTIHQKKSSSTYSTCPLSSQVGLSQSYIS